MSDFSGVCLILVVSVLFWRRRSSVCLWHVCFLLQRIVSAQSLNEDDIEWDAPEDPPPSILRLLSITSSLRRPKGTLFLLFCSDGLFFMKWPVLGPWISQPWNPKKFKRLSPLKPVWANQTASRTGFTLSAMLASISSAQTRQYLLFCHFSAEERKINMFDVDSCVVVFLKPKQNKMAASTSPSRHRKWPHRLWSSSS